MKGTVRIAVASITVAASILAVAGAAGAGEWTRRMGNPQNTNNAGAVAGLDAADATRLEVEALYPTSGVVNATPVVSDGLLFIGDGGPNGRFFYVFDLATGATLVKLDTGATVSTPLIGNGIQSTALVATVTVPEGQGTREERRVYFGANVKPKSLWCLSVDAILAKKAELVEDDGSQFLCAGADWPIMIAGLGDVEGDDLSPLGGVTSPLPVYNSSPMFAKDREVQDMSGKIRTADVLYTATIGADCSDGQFWALDAVTAELFWIYDPVPNFQNLTQSTPAGAVTAHPGYGGVIWTMPAMSADGSHLYLTTGDCVEQPQVGFQAESLVALDPVNGNVQWFHQRRLVDTSDYDVGNAPAVVDVQDERGGCHVIVSTDKNGCIYGFEQRGDIPQAGTADFDPTRIGQQRVLWRTCFVPGSLAGGFNASGPSVNGRYVFAQASGTGGRAPGDDVNAFAVDACTGDYLWSTSSISSGSGEGAIASGMWFQPSGSKLQVIRATPTGEVVPGATQFDHLATVDLKLGEVQLSSTPGGGGPAIVDGKIYVPVRSGIARIGVGADPNRSLPVTSGTNSFGGPYPAPLGTGVEQVMMPIDPYDADSPPAGPVAEWPSMNP